MIIIGSRRKSSSLHTRTIPSYGLDKPSLVFTPNSDVEEDGEDEGDDEDEEDEEDEEEEGEDCGGNVQQEGRSVDDSIADNEVRAKDNHHKQYMYECISNFLITNFIILNLFLNLFIKE